MTEQLTFYRILDSCIEDAVSNKILQNGEYKNRIIVKIQSLGINSRHYEGIAIDELLSGKEYNISTIFGDMNLFKQTNGGKGNIQNERFSFLLSDVSVKYDIESKRFDVIGFELH